jgi:hypothetical protein
VLTAFRRLRACYPRRRRLYVIMDNLNTHRHSLLRAFYRTQHITVVPQPTSDHGGGVTCGLVHFACALVVYRWWCWDRLLVN